MTTFYDDGEWNWKYDCQYVTPTNNPKDYSFQIAFETKDGGYMDGNEITCRYWKTENELQIIRKKTKVNFRVYGFGDIKKIVLPMVEAYQAKPYPIYESKMSIIRKTRKAKLEKIQNSIKKFLLN